MSEPSLAPAALQALVTFIIVGTFFGSVLVPLILTLIFFSTPESRRHPVFILTIIACCCGICEAAIGLALNVPTIIYPSQQVSKSLYVATACLSLVSGIFVDSILLFRILVFYPLSVTPINMTLKIFALPVLTKCGRFAVAMNYIYQFTHANSPNIELSAQSIWPRNPFVLTYASLQVIDNSYASGILLYKINQFRRERDEIFKISGRSLVTFLRSLFIIALGNFVFPVAINIVSITMLAVNPSYFKDSVVFQIDNYISIVGVVFATIWTRRRYWNKHNRMPGPDDFQLETYRHVAPFSSGLAQTVLSTIHFGNENTESVHDSGERKGQGNVDSDLNNLHPS